MKTAINKSELIDVVKESRALSTQQSWQHKENKEQMEELKNLLREQNALLKELISQKSGL
ncbi:FixJ family two-component response regulator [Paenibacillus shirakamiensis]|uniref:FixJ family two-component response regulator n=1 Tax=Paenibacillus shirakamiensis TaxID=1265935 RepID=A0ABS4JIE4_9BACL|nr:hypothetical protein [Paenibacillus shirakamiensis]MBP2001489.1 FixJ family two-component response regulator [Paenibacillus shirakamiensis]